MIRLEDLQTNAAVRGLLPDCLVTVVSVQWFGSEALELTYKTPSRNPVRARISEDPATYAWSSCASYALGAPNRLIQFHPGRLGLSPYARVRQRHYRAILAPGSDPHVDDRDSRWTSQRAVGSPEFLKRHHPSGKQQGTILLPEQIRKVRK